MEAAIAYEHCIAQTFEESNWPNILRYYDLLVAIHPNAVVALHRLTVIFKVSGMQRTLEEIDRSDFRTEWEKNYLYYALLWRYVREPRSKDVGRLLPESQRHGPVSSREEAAFEENWGPL